MWDGRSVTLTDHEGRSIEAVPTGIARTTGRDRLWVVAYYAPTRRHPEEQSSCGSTRSTDTERPITFLLALAKWKILPIVS